MLLPDSMTANIWDTPGAMRCGVNHLFYEIQAHMPVNIWSSKEELVVHALATGVSSDDIEILAS